MIEENEVRNNISKDVSERGLEELHLPSLDPKLAYYQAEMEKKCAIVELGLKHINTDVQERKFWWEWNELAEEKEKLRNLFLDSNKSVKENKSSISRFCEIIREQKEQKIKLNQEILHTQEDIDEYKEIKEMMEKYVKQYSIFENFLEDVAAISSAGDLLSVRDILNRYETLEGTRMDLTRILEAEMETEAQMRKQMIALLEEKSSTLKALSNHLVMLQVTRRQALDHRNYWEMIVQRIKNMILAREEQAIVLRGACWDLYNLICTHRKVHTKVPSNDMKAQLNYIQKSIMFYKEVLTIATGSKTGGGKDMQKKRKYN